MSATTVGVSYRVTQISARGHAWSSVCHFLHSSVTSTKLISGWFCAHDANARCIAAFRSLHVRNSTKKKSSLKRGSSFGQSAPSHAHVIPIPSPRDSLLASGLCQRNPSDCCALETFTPRWLEEMR